MQIVKTWSMFEQSFEAASSYAAPHLQRNEPSCVVRFSHPESEYQTTVNGFWDGDKTWCVRFAPSVEGIWEWVTTSTDSGLDGQSGSFRCDSPGDSEIAENPNLRGPVKTDPTGRFFVYADGTPCFLLADTNWSMNTTRCGLSGDDGGRFGTWLADRRAKGFTAVMTQMFEIDQANEGGYLFPDNTQRPGTGDYAQMNVDFMRWLDKRMAALWTGGWVVCAVPTWIGKYTGMNRGDAIALWQYLQARYGVYNMIWALSGEYQYAYTNTAEPWTKGDWQALGQAFRDGDVYGRPLSLHPSSRQDPEDPAEWPPEAHQASSGGEFHDEPWLDHNWLQTGHALELLPQVPQRVTENYVRTPHRPVLHAEGYYERQQPAGASSRMIRWQAWVAYLSGAAGHAYGANGLWQFYDGVKSKDGGETQPETQPWHGLAWSDALQFEGSGQIKHLADLAKTVPWHRLEPHREWLRIRGVPARPESMTDPHCAAIPEELYILYIPAGNSGKRIEISHLGTRTYQAQWLDPRTGEITNAGDEPAQGTGTDSSWRAPSVFRHQDWVLILRAIG